MIITARLQLRQWRKTDLPKFAALNADPEVMEFMTTTLSRSESDALAARIRDEIASSGWGVWAVEILGGAPFIYVIRTSLPEQDMVADDPDLSDCHNQNLKPISLPAPRLDGVSHGNTGVMATRPRLPWPRVPLRSIN